ncbi:Tcp11-domain-containing protein [Hortaea werneckii]|nr:Tcp11-domain-containing protein [Hortaea werneckii]KAI7589145.1 Tcp11-domain-containing protein [Hortaea werneckii]KAI7670618.1 Tcp11-domain-containing protein [Hortaea werneckii]RMY06275.1 hypothetical protein D0867_09753 [Hortaea werneckii]
MSDTPSPGDGQVYAPPAHLAARFYRNRAGLRRKSSATSSRRNSLSSAQSHTSSRRSASIAGCQSHYVAQHLRRASIIESRKARLADRAAHAEQVRLRAALAKATPRGSDSKSEERALAAQIAKEKYLAKVAAACAEEVARAKRIAEEVKERKLAEETRQRLEMEERHAEAEKRRQEYQRNLQARRARRAESADNPKKLAVVDEISDDVFSEEAVLDDEDPEPVLPPTKQPLDDETAAYRIQRAWRLSRRRGVVSAFTKLDLNTSRETTFDDMTTLLADSNVVAAATGLLTQLGLQTPHDENAALNTRTFLSAFLMVAHPAAVLTNVNGAQEQDVLSKATDLLANFENTLSRLADWNSWSPSATQLETLSQSYSSYTSAFAAWRLQDSSVLIEGMVASFVELDAIWQTVKDDSRGEVASDYAQGIRDNQVMLLSRIRKLAGADRADVLIKKAIRESRKRKPKRRNAAEVRPRGVEPSQHEPESGASGGAADVPVELDDSGDAHAERAAENTSDVTKKLFTPMPSNRVLTHELAIDKDYRLADSTETAALREDLYRSICSAMRQGFEDGSGGLWTLSAAENVREKLLRMLKPGNSMHTLISETLDLENISRQCQAGIFSYQGFFEFMANVLPKLCAPFRDQEIAALAAELQQTSSDLGEAEQIDAMINKLFKVLRAVDLLSLDYTNFMIMNAAPMLIKEAAGYERRAFEQDLRNGKIDLSNTRRWWRTSLDQLNAEADRRDPEGLRLDRPKSNKVYAHGLVSLALDQSPHTLLEDHQWPETLHLDVERFSALKQQAVRATVIGAILLTAKNLLKRDVRAQWNQQAGRMWALLSQEPFVSDSNNNNDTASGADTTPSTADKAFAILETANNMPPATKLQVQNTIARFFAQAASASASSSSLSSSSSNNSTPSSGTTTPRFTDPVLKVLFHRLRTHLLSRLSATTSAERVRAASSANENLTSIGLGELSQHVAAMVDVLERVRRVDWEAHGFVYEGLVGGEEHG